MRKLLLLLAVLSLTMLVACDEKITIDFARDAAFETYNSFAWDNTTNTSLKEDHPLIHSRLKNSIEHYLAEGGMVEDTENPDVYVTYHTSTKSEVSVNTTSTGYGYGPGWGTYYGGYYGGGMSSSQTTISEYDRGTLVIDIWDAAKKELVWRGSGSGVVEDDSQKVSKQLDNFVKKMVEEWERIKKKEFPPEKPLEE